ncbi:MAG: phosphoenolpyruvate carboxykinase (ATP) [Holophagales bacterium]|nr:phosphoenolpyruvate carboxykinase (ATP) [Holophagales bacterium]MYG32153.1 phosphoenolpyruvate carboxykinase (ATP) [Holophagales bacterium]MYI80238.1 phosphoenolpyruvate carboxykinase (ATP) [Holophagales bacterium]
MVEVSEEFLSANRRVVHRRLSVARLYEEAVRRGEAAIAAEGPLVASTGEHTGRSPNDRFVVRRAPSADLVDWGPVNKPLAPEHFNRLHRKMLAAAADRDLFVFDGFAGADPACRLNVRVISERAWHSLFVRNMFLRAANDAELEDFKPDYTVVDIPSVLADPESDGTNSTTFIALDLERHLTLIGGSEYAGEMKKSMFSVMNFLMPQRGVLSMHCSANYGADRSDCALFFGLSGTGKTTLSADPERTLIGDDEHGWSDRGIFNIEGGCYAKVIRLDPLGEPEIYATTRRFGTVLENVVFDPETRELDLDDDSRTENTRASYPLSHLEHVDVGGNAGHPTSVIFLTCDAFGVLPPISRLDESQAMYHFLSGYTAKVAGTERGVTEPSATFSACFGAPFMPLPASTYADLLGEKVRRHGVDVWLVNTGWTRGPYGQGSRIKLAYTRRMIHAALDGSLTDTPVRTHPVFGLAYPTAIDGVPGDVLDPRQGWSDPQAYDQYARRLARMFTDNFEGLGCSASAAVQAAAPRVAV